MPGVVFINIAASPRGPLPIYAPSRNHRGMKQHRIDGPRVPNACPAPAVWGLHHQVIAVAPEPALRLHRALPALGMVCPQAASEGLAPVRRLQHGQCGVAAIV
jgi:hypothetical protein